MANFNILYICSAILAIGLVQAAPWPVHVKHATHRTRVYGRALEVESFHPQSTFKTFGAIGVPAPGGGDSSTASLTSDGTTGSGWRLNDSAIAFARSELGVDENSIRYHNGWSGPNGKFAYLKQCVDDIPVANAVANVGYSNESTVISFGSSFVKTEGATVAPSTPTIAWGDVLPTIEASLEGKHTGDTPTLEYLARPDGSLALTHVLQIRNESTGLHVEAYIDAHSGELLSVTDFVAHASYTVVPIQSPNFFDGRELLVDPADLASSPQGWHQLNETVQTRTTSGNNVQAFTGNTIIAESSEGLNFNFDYDDNQPQVATSVSAAVTNAFYVMNVMHDVSYRYGFTESAGNFQNDNFDKGGRGADRVLLSVQDGAGANNADFSTPPDGFPGSCRLFLFDQTNPERDSALSNDIIIHEFTHGITNRMTGGGTARCLQTVEAGGMGEGWSDMMAAWIAQTSDEVPDLPIGAYVTGGTRGIRSFDYSTSEDTNPLKYADVAASREPHKIGEVWANMLYNVYGDLVLERGFSANSLTDPDGLEGNIVFMRLMMDGLLFQPCNPTMVQARDAILQADENLYNGANGCIISNAFARKGLGVNADGSFQNDFTVPAGC